MRIEQLQLILALSSTGSVRAAAEQMHVTAPALSKALRKLEDEFGAALVSRSPMGVRLTTAGELLAVRAKIALREINRAKEEVSWHLQHQRANLTVTASPAAAFHLLPGALSRYRQRWPQVYVRVLEVSYPRSLAMLRAGEVDLSIGPIPPEGVGRDLVCQSLFEVQLVVIARGDHPLKDAKSLRELEGAEWINTGSPGGPGDPIHLHFEEQGLEPPKLTLSCESLITVLAILPSTDALVLVPDSFYSLFAQKHGMIRLAIEEPLPRIKVWATWRADAPLTTPSAYLLDFLELAAKDI